MNSPFMIWYVYLFQVIDSSSHKLVLIVMLGLLIIQTILWFLYCFWMGVYWLMESFLKRSVIWTRSLCLYSNSFSFKIGLFLFRSVIRSWLYYLMLVKFPTILHRCILISIDHFVFLKCSIKQLFWILIRKIYEGLTHILILFYLRRPYQTMLIFAIVLLLSIQSFKFTNNLGLESIRFG